MNVSLVDSTYGTDLLQHHNPSQSKTLKLEQFYSLGKTFKLMCNVTCN